MWEDGSSRSQMTITGLRLSVYGSDLESNLTIDYFYYTTLPA